MTDAEKIEWLSATNKALMESQERLAGEIKQLRKLLSQTLVWIGNEPRSLKANWAIDELKENIDKVLG